MQEAVYGAMLVDRRTTRSIVGSHISSGQYFNPVCRGNVDKPSSRRGGRLRCLQMHPQTPLGGTLRPL